MLNKKGFTLVEVTISVALLSLIMVFLLGFLSEIRKDEDTINKNTEMLLNKSIISKAINEDIRNSGGIKSAECTSNLCNIILNDDTNKQLQIENNILTYTDITNSNIELTRKLNNNYTITINSNNGLTLIKLSNSNKEYDIDITDYQI